MSDSKQFAPLGIENLRVFITAYDGIQIDITQNVSNISIYESIFSRFLFGDLLISDNSGMLSSLPFLGQEKLLIRWEREEEEYEREFFTTGIESAIPEINTRGRYKVKFTSESQMLNSTNIFSKSYTLSSDQIIQNICSEYLNTDLLIDARGDSTYNIVFPFIKPYQAINQILQKNLSEDQTPLFLFDRFYETDNPVILTSYQKMFDQEPILKMFPMKSINSFNNERNEIELYQVYRYNILKTFKTLDQISSGAFSSIERKIDISNKSNADDQSFYFKEDSVEIGNEWIKDGFEFDKSVSNRMYLIEDSFAFDNGFRNIHSTSDLSSSIIKSFMARIDSTTIQAEINPIAYTIEDDIPFTVGKTVDFSVPLFMPITEDIKYEELKNKLLSGKYLITSIHHQIEGKQYRMVIELSRDFIGEEATL